jgi:SAM-dependent methyltransferase
LRGLDPDSPEASIVRAKIVREKPYLEKIYANWYASIAAALPAFVEGPVLELGSGGGFLDESIPGLITSEVFQVPGVDLVADGQRLPFQDQTLRAIVMLDVLHHLPKVKRFFLEAQRCIKPGGVVVMVEPWLTSWSKIVYRYLHQEPFRPEAKGWHFPVGGPLSQANSALPWIVFQRDVTLFKRRFPLWRIEEITLNGAVGYLLTGGVSYRSFLPDWILGPVGRVENTLLDHLPSLGMFARIVLTHKE